MWINHWQSKRTKTKTYRIQIIPKWTVNIPSWRQNLPKWSENVPNAE